MAAQSGKENVIANILAEWPNLATEYDSGGDKTALLYASEKGYEKIVALLLTACPSVVDAKTSYNPRNALHLAAENGHAQVVAQLLAASPSLITSTSESGRTALSFAVENGHEEVFAQLLAACPELIDKDPRVLHHAARNGHDNMVAQIVALRPESISVVANGWTPLVWAVFRGHEQIAERLLAIKTDEVFADVAPLDCSLLHVASRTCSREFVAKLLRMNPRALHHTIPNHMPFFNALMFQRDDLIELFQWSQSFDEIVEVFTQLKESYQERYLPVMERQCEGLFESIGRDVTDIVFEYLGLEPHKRTSCKRPRP